MTFLDNKYTLWYYNIISQANTRELDSDVYVEQHHVIPRSMGGSLQANNLVKLTGREHFICHMLLVKMTIGIAKYKMVHAAIGMKRARNYQQRYINSRLYDIVRKEFAQISRERNAGKSISAETRTKMSLAGKGKKKPDGFGEKISAALKGKPKGPMSEENKLKISQSTKGKSKPKKKSGKYKHTIEARAKISESNKKRIYSEETRAKISEGVKAAQLRKKSAMSI
jgi:hypothetical protein